MPIYEFEHLETKEIWTATMPYAEKDKYMEDHKCRAYFSTVPQVIGTSKDIYAKSSDDFKGRMKAIKKHYPSKGKNKHNMESW
jgi:hypothetical protein